MRYGSTLKTESVVHFLEKEVIVKHFCGPIVVTCIVVTCIPCQRNFPTAALAMTIMTQPI